MILGDFGRILQGVCKRFHGAYVILQGVGFPDNQNTRLPFQNFGLSSVWDLRCILLYSSPLKGLPFFLGGGGRCLLQGFGFRIFRVLRHIRYLWADGYSELPSVGA